MTYRTLSIALTDLLAEAQSLLDLRAGFGRLPNSSVKTEALKSIDEWFNAKSDETFRRKLKLTSLNKAPTNAVNSTQEVGSLSSTDGSAMADMVPDDDDIPF